jgi:hypothetical protein
MSYLFDADDDRLDGTFTTDRSLPITIAAWVKKSDWPINDGGIAMLSDTGDDDPAIYIQTETAADSVTVTARSAASDDWRRYAFTAEAYDGDWVVVVGIFTSATDRRICIEEWAKSATDPDSVDPGSTLNNIMIGNHNTSTADKALVQADVDALQTATGASAGGPAPNTIQSGNVIGYWSLKSTDSNNGRDNQGSDATGDLSVQGAPTSESDHHPIITGAVTITDVDGDEQWDDGATGLIITGTGFV